MSRLIYPTGSVQIGGPVGGSAVYDGAVNSDSLTIYVDTPMRITQAGTLTQWTYYTNSAGSFTTSIWHVKPIASASTSRLTLIAKFSIEATQVGRQVSYSISHIQAQLTDALLVIKKRNKPLFM